MRLEVESLKARLVTQTQMDGHGTGTLNGVTQIQMQEMVRELSCGPLSLSLSLSLSLLLPLPLSLSYLFSLTISHRHSTNHMPLNQILIFLVVYSKVNMRRREAD